MEKRLPYGAGTRPPVDKAPPYGGMTEDSHLAHLAREWQRILRLKDWDIRVRFAHAHDLSTDAQAECRWTLSSKKAVLLILYPEEYDDFIAFQQDIEKSLVHELLHLHFAPFAAETGTPEDTAQEQAIDLIACGLVNLKRG